MIDWHAIFKHRGEIPPPDDDPDVLLIPTFEEALAILIKVFPFGVEPAALREYGHHHPPYVNGDQYVAMNAWCEQTYETPDADDKRFSLGSRSRRLYLNRNWCIINGLVRFRTEPDAIAFKLRWG